MFSYSLYVVCCLYVTFLLLPERAPKAGLCHLYYMDFNYCRNGLPSHLKSMYFDIRKMNDAVYPRQDLKTLNDDTNKIVNHCLLNEWQDVKVSDSVINCLVLSV